MRDADEAAEFLWELRQRFGLSETAPATEIARVISITWHQMLPRITATGNDDVAYRRLVDEICQLADTHRRVRSLLR